MTDPDLVSTRRALHAVAELLLAGPQHRAAGTIKLRVAAGGFRTWTGPERAVVGTELVSAGSAVPLSGRTARELAAALGIDAGAPVGVYGDGSGTGVDDVLAVEPAAAQRIAESFAHGDAALRLLAPDADPVLWPEHFDVGIRVDGVNYGVSPGDAYLAEPYAYVGVDPVPADDPFWDAPFGAARPLASLSGAAGVHDFFADARGRRR